MAKKQIRCPACGSQDFQILGSSKKSVSIGKGVVGGALLGPIGAIGGAAMGKKGKYDIVCNQCGNRWQQK